MGDILEDYLRIKAEYDASTGSFSRDINAESNQSATPTWANQNPDPTYDDPEEQAVMSSRKRYPENPTLDLYSYFQAEKSIRDLRERKSAAIGQKNLENRNPFMRGLYRGFDTLQATYQGGLGMLSSLAGDETSAQQRFQAYQDEMRQASENPRDNIDFFSTDPETGAFGSVGNFGTYAAGTLGEAIPSLAESVLTGIAGAALGAAVVPAPDPADVVTVPVGAVGGILGKGAIKKAISNAAAEYVKRGIAADAAEGLAKQYVGREVARRVGSAAATTAVTGLHEGGGMYMEGREAGYDSPGTALGLGLVSGLSESLLGAAPGVLKSFAGRSGVDEIARREGWRAAAGYLWDTVKASGEEGVQEGFQEFLGSLNKEINDPNFDLFNKENFMQWAEAAAGGALVGGAVKSGTTGVELVGLRGGRGGRRSADSDADPFLPQLPPGADTSEDLSNVQARLELLKRAVNEVTTGKRESFPRELARQLKLVKEKDDDKRILIDIATGEPTTKDNRLASAQKEIEKLEEQIRSMLGSSADEAAPPAAAPPPNDAFEQPTAPGTPPQQRSTPAVREKRTRTDYQINTEDAGAMNTAVFRMEDGSVAIMADGFNPIEYNSAFAKDKSDEELLAFAFEPLGFLGVNLNKPPQQPPVDPSNEESLVNDQQLARQAAMEMERMRSEAAQPAVPPSDQPQSPAAQPEAIPPSTDPFPPASEQVVPPAAQQPPVSQPEGMPPSTNPFDVPLRQAPQEAQVQQPQSQTAISDYSVRPTETEGTNPFEVAAATPLPAKKISYRKQQAPPPQSSDPFTVQNPIEPTPVDAVSVGAQGEEVSDAQGTRKGGGPNVEVQTEGGQRPSEGQIIPMEEQAAGSPSPVSFQPAEAGMSMPSEVKDQRAQYAEIKQNAAGVKKTVRAEKGGRTLLLEQSKNDETWSVREMGDGEKKSKKLEFIVSGVLDQRKAKSVAERIFDDTYDPDSEKIFDLQDKNSLAYTNDKLSRLWSVANKGNLASTLSNTGYYTDGRVLVKVSDKDKEAILAKADVKVPGRIINIDSVVSPAKEQRKYADNEMSVVGYRGGDLSSRVVMLKNKAGQYAIVDKAYHDTVMKRHPNAKIWGSAPKGKSIESSILYELEGDAVGLVMPMSGGKIDKYLAAMIEGKYEEATRPEKSNAKPTVKTSESEVPSTPAVEQAAPSPADVSEPPAKKKKKPAVAAKQDASESPARTYLKSLSKEELQDLAADLRVKATVDEILDKLNSKPSIKEFLETAAPEATPRGKKKRQAAPRGESNADTSLPKKPEGKEIPSEDFTEDERKQEQILKKIGITLRLVEGGPDQGVPGLFIPESRTIWLDRNYSQELDRDWKEKGRPEKAMTWGLFAHEMFHAIKRSSPKTWRSLYNWVSENDPVGLGKAKVAYLADMKKVDTGYYEDLLKDEDLLNDEGLSRYLEDRAAYFKFWNDLGKAKPGLLARIGRWVRRVLRFAEPGATNPNTLAGQTRQAIERAMKQHNVAMKGKGGRRASPGRVEKELSEKPFTPDVIERIFGVPKDVAIAISSIAEAMGLDKSRIQLVKGGMPAENALFQVHKILSGEEPIAVQKTLKSAVAWIGEYANQNKVVPEGIDFNTSAGQKAAVDAIVKHTLLEIGAWKKLNRSYVSFYTTDIIDRANPWLSKWAKRDKDIAAKMAAEGRDKLTDDEVKLLHIMGSFSSANAIPSVDTLIGLMVLKEWMLHGTLTGMTSNPKHVWKTDYNAPRDMNGQRPRKPTYVTPRGKITFESSRVTSSGKKIPNEPNLVPGKFKKISRTFNLASARSFSKLVDHFGGGKSGLAKAIKWMESEHTWAEIVAVIGDKAAKKLKVHEYLKRDLKNPNDPNLKVVGAFALGDNPKQGSYILNRWQKLKTITKDMWVARTMSRYFREPNTGVPWKHTNQLGRIKRQILEDAWVQVAENLGVEPAIVQEMMWDMEKLFYGMMGVSTDTSYPSDGVLRSITASVKASVELTDSGIALMRAFNKPTIADGIHELGHVARMFLFDKSIPQDMREGITDADIDVAMKWSGVVDGNWTTEAEEKFANGLLKYIKGGKFPSKGLKAVFEKVVSWLRKIYKSIDKKADSDPVASLEISPAMQEVYDKLVSRGIKDSQLSWEAIPSKTLDIIPEIHNASYAVKKEYLKRITDVLFKNGDWIAKAVGLDVPVTITGFSAWQGDIGAGSQSKFEVMLENNGGVKTITEEYRKKLDLYANVLGYVLSQDGVYWHLPVYSGDPALANGFEITGARAWKGPEFQDLYDAMLREFGKDTDLAPAFMPNGARILNFSIENLDFHSRMEKVVNALQKSNPDFLGGGGKTKLFRSEGNEYNATSNDWRSNPNGEVYTSRIGGTGRPDLQRRSDNVRQAVISATRKFAREQGWNTEFTAAPIKDSGRRASPVRRRDTGYNSRSQTPLADAPKKQGATGPDREVVQAAERYARSVGIDLKRQASYVDIDEDRAKRIAKAYADMPHSPNDPAVKEAYADLIRQTRAQYDALVEAGYTFTFFDGDTDPYDGNPVAAVRDLRQNKTMAVFGTYAGFGTAGITDAALDDNPMLADSGLEWKDQKGVSHPVTANDLFRAVHDAFGHSLEGASFRARGEENAWQAHVRLFYGPAIKAMTSETRGQNSWLNFGPYAEANKTALTKDTVFAENKIGLMPDWTWTEGRAADMEETGDEVVRYSPGRQVKKKRDPEVTKAAQDLKAGLIDRDQYQRIVDMRMPLRKFDKVPTPASREDMIRGLANYKAGTRLKRDLVQNPEAIAAGMVLEARLDIPAYENEDVWVVTLHQPRSNIKKGTAAKVVAFTPTAVLKNVTFGVTEYAALNIAAGKPKATIATMRGEYVPMTAKQAYKLAETNKDRWVEIGMNPIRHTYFYDKDTQTPVVSAEEVVQVGGMVLAKNPEPGQRDAYRYSPSRRKKGDTLAGLYKLLEEEGLIKPQSQRTPSGEGETTGTKNVKTNELRARLGLGDRVMPPRESEEQWQQEAARLIANDSGYPARLAEELRVDPRPITPVEEAVLNRHIRELANRRMSKDVVDDVLTAVEASEQVGRIWGQTGRSRQIELESDFSIAGIIRRHLREVQQRPTEEQLQEYAELAERYKKLEEDNKKLVEELAKETIARKKAEAAAQPEPEKPKLGTKRASVVKKVADAFSVFQNLWSGGNRPAAGRNPDIRYSPSRQPNDIKAAANNVVSALREAGVSSILELEAQIKANLLNASPEQIQAIRDAWNESIAKNKPESPIGDNPTDPELGARAKELMRAAIELGYGAEKEDWMDVVDVVYEQLSSEVPGISKYETMQAMSDYGVWQSLNTEPVEVIIRAIRGKARQSLKIEDTYAAIKQSEEWLKDGVSPEEVARRLRDKGLLPKATGQERATPDSIERELISQFNKLKKTLPVPAESKEGQLKSALATAKTAANNRLEILDKDIAALDEAIKNRKELVKPVAEKTALEPDEELAGLREQLEQKRRIRDELKADYEKIFPPTKPKKGRKPLTEEQRLDASVRMLERQISAVKADVKALEDGTWAPAAKNPELTSERKEELMAELRSLRQLRKVALEANPVYQATEELKYWQRYRKSQERRLAFWQRRLEEAKAGRIPVPLKKRTITEKAILEKNMEIEEVQYDAMIAIEKAKRATWNTGQWIGQGLLEATSLIPKTLMLGMEMSFVLRQGFFYTYSQPMKSFYALMEAIPAVFSQRLALESADGLKNRPNAKEYELAKVDFTQVTGPQAKLEELYQSAIIRWLENTETKLLLPLRTWAKLYAMAERGNRTFSNIMKADMYDIQKRDTLAAREFFGVNTGWTEDDIKETGRIANIFSGRGTGLKGGNPWLDWLFLARRWTWSRIQADFIAPFQLVTPQWIGQWNADRGMRVALAKLYIQAMVGHTAKMAAAYVAYRLLAGDDEEEMPTFEFDLRSSDALAMKIGETRFKDEGGLMPAVVLASRVLTGKMKTSEGEIKSIYGDDVQYGGKTAADFIINYGRYKLGTAPSAILEWASGRDAVGNVIADKDDPTAIYRNIVGSRITPLTYREIYAAESELGLKRGTLAALEAFFGVSVSTHGSRSEYKKASEEDRKKQFEKDLEAMEYNTPDFGYKDLLTDKQVKQMFDQREAKKQAIVYAALANPQRKTHKSDESFQKSVAERDKAIEKFREMGLDFNNARLMLLDYYKRQYGSAYEMRGKNYVLRESYVQRLRQLRKVLERK